MKEKTFNNLYISKTVDQWKEEKTMEHSSGIWGRTPMLEYLKKDVIKKGDTVVDLGSGAGYPSLKISEMVGDKGNVLGVELSKAQLGMEEELIPLTKKYKEVKNLNFINGNIKNIPIEDESADKIVSFMVLHNIKIDEIKEVFIETSRIMKSEGKAVFLTIHPDFLESDWDLDFSEV
jgi:ubiquinone/menaquinone biosynthesis C-methylase UbiE